VFYTRSLLTYFIVALSNGPASEGLRGKNKGRERTTDMEKTGKGRIGEGTGGKRERRRKRMKLF